jgi:hypothetical protein
MKDGNDKKVVPKEKDDNNMVISINRTPIFGRTYATNVLVSTTDSDFRVELLSEKFKTEDGWSYQSDHMVMLTRESAKKLLLDLEKQISRYEDENGEIVVSDERCLVGQ